MSYIVELTFRSRKPASAQEAADYIALDVR